MRDRIILAISNTSSISQDKFVLLPQVGVEALMRAPAVRGLGSELQEVIQRMLVKGKPDFVPLTEEAEERLATAKKQKVAEEEKAVEEEQAAEKGRSTLILVKNKPHFGL